MTVKNEINFSNFTYVRKAEGLKGSYSDVSNPFSATLAHIETMKNIQEN